MRLSRRALLAAAAAATAAAAARADSPPLLHLRLLETSDLHMFALDWDYYHAKTDATVGLNRLATLIAKARADAPNALLFDNGDLIQGNPLGDYLARDADAAAWSAPWDDAHPMLRAMNALRYDAATLGNHEFNFGVPFLERALAGAQFPYVCANVARADGSVFMPPFRIIERDMRDDAGATHRLRIGVIGFAPPQIAVWDKARVEGKILCDDALDAARRHIPQLRAACDVLVVLCHGGLTTRPAARNEENPGLQLAEIPGVDAIMLGHAHRVFPGADYAGYEGVDAARGALRGVPAVMPGFWGSHLGAIDLFLTKGVAGWRVADFRVEAQPIYRRDAGGAVVALAAPDAGLEPLIATEHAATRAWVDAPVGRLDAPLSSLFTFTGDDPVTALVNAAQRAYAADALRETPYADLPLLSAAAPFRVGYTPDAFIDLAPGPLALRHIADIYPYPNTLVVVRLAGAQILEWLECAARIFAKIDVGATKAQELLDKRAATYNFDAIAGLEYEIDLAQPARYGRSGEIVAPDARRIARVRFQGRPLDPDQRFLVATNNYRADGGGRFPGLDGSNVVLRAPDSNRDVVLRFLRGTPTAPPLVTPWRFASFGKKTTLAVDTAIGALAQLARHPGLRAIDGAAPGYARIAFDLD
jgi:2',3'-cyclic-nucleotide 2'-phosphodiesterase / 3'-nucleotidase